MSEYLYRRNKEKEEAFIKPENIYMEREEFENLVKKGRKLVILDDMVLDVAKFLTCHPGGYFVLNHNIGRDISKFFYGGYCVDGN